MIAAVSVALASFAAVTPSALASSARPGASVIAQASTGATINSPDQVPQCNAVNDGKYWKSPNGIWYQCRYVEGVGFQWVPCLCCPPGTAALRVSPVVVQQDLLPYSAKRGILPATWEPARPVAC